MVYICLRRSFKLENTLNVSSKLWEQIKEIENPDAPTFEEFFKKVNSYVKEKFKGNMKNIAEENIDFVAICYRGNLKRFNRGLINREQFLTAKVWAAASNLYMM